MELDEHLQIYNVKLYLDILSHFFGQYHATHSNLYTDSKQLSIFDQTD